MLVSVEGMTDLFLGPVVLVLQDAVLALEVAHVVGQPGHLRPGRVQLILRSPKPRLQHVLLQFSSFKLIIEEKERLM
jgi:hypothetical protein